MIEMKKVEPVHDLDALAEMAHDIWFEYWPAHIGADQTAYMVEQFQSKPRSRATSLSMTTNTIL